MDEGYIQGKNVIILIVIIVVSVCILGIGGSFIYDRLLDKPKNDKTTTTTTKKVIQITEENEFESIIDKGYVLFDDKAFTEDFSLNDVKWKEIAIPTKRTTTSFIDGFKKLEDNFDKFYADFTKEKYELDGENELCGPNTYTFSLIDNVLTYKTNSGYVQTIKNVKSFKYKSYDFDEGDYLTYYLFVIRENGELWKYSFNAKYCDVNNKFEKVDGEYTDVLYIGEKTFGVDSGTINDLIYVGKNGEYYYEKDNRKVNISSIDGVSSSYINKDGYVYINDKKTNIDYISIIELEEEHIEYKEFVGLIDTNNHLWIYNDSIWYRYPSKLVKIYEYLEQIKGKTNTRALKLSFANGKNYYVYAETENGCIKIN